ncbi:MULTISPECIES: nitroreductase family protein [Rhodoplanes]|jgi:nitroreductase|uniref:Putative NAD(P)H nitroreductase n=1 Tax=Rhodoplanes serenus TaxID=200615 RepID=A0A327K1D7_9BRAD|nr:nitroreductase [Rhodoplanes serenus]RAI32609.1 nitroreductase [Rhodoplanes serenus]VCU08777.1 Putative NAD(P)H nitroreductase YdjA [Rhodoplanes serenus]
MPDALALLKTRRSVKPDQLSGPPPTADEIDTMLTIAARVPDHGRLVPWRFILFEGDHREEAGAAIASAYAAKYPDATGDQLYFETQRLARAPLVIGVVCSAQPGQKIPEWEQQLSGAAVAMNLLHAATALGYAASWLTEWYAYDRQVMRAYGLEDHERFIGFVHVGRHDGTPEDRPRPALADIVTRFEA